MAVLCQRCRPLGILGNDHQLLHGIYLSHRYDDDTTVAKLIKESYRKLWCRSAHVNGVKWSRLCECVGEQAERFQSLRMPRQRTNHLVDLHSRHQQ